jgi:hypothetical protein
MRFKFLLPGILLLGGLACSSPDVSGPTSMNPAELAWRMTLSAHAITMSTVAPYDTLQVAATPMSATGASLLDASSVTFTSSDSSVRVSPTGLLTARQVQNGVRVIATTVYHGIRLSDTAIVNVTAVAHPPTFQRLQLQVFPGDSTTIPADGGAVASWTFKYGFNGEKPLQIGALDSTGTPINNSLVALRISDVQQAYLYGNGEGQNASMVNGSTTEYLELTTITHPGVVRVYIAATVYGVTRQDSLDFTFTNPVLSVYFVTTPDSGATYALQTDYATPIAVGGYVWWGNATPDSLDIIFDDPTAATADFAAFNMNSGGGNIAPFLGSVGCKTVNCIDFLSENVRSRQFLRVGTFTWHSVRTGVSGTIVVQ